jgi:hypothetical protein
MKRTVLWLVAIVLMALSGCKQTIDYEKEKQAIIDVINRETRAYVDRDMETVFATHVHDSLNMRLTAGADNYVFIEGWEAHAKHLAGDETEDDLGPDLHINVKKYNYRMKIYPNSAFVVCNQTWTSSYEDDTTNIESIQVRFLEKIEGEWKISFVSFIGTSGYRQHEETELLAD